MEITEEVKKEVMTEEQVKVNEMACKFRDDLEKLGYDCVLCLSKDNSGKDEDGSDTTDAMIVTHCSNVKEAMFIKTMFDENPKLPLMVAMMSMDSMIDKFKEKAKDVKEEENSEEKRVLQ